MQRIPVELAGRRFDQALAELFPDYSRSRLTAWIKSGDALLDGETVAPRTIVHGGEAITLELRAWSARSARWPRTSRSTSATRTAK